VIDSNKAQEFVVVDFLREDVSPVTQGDLGIPFLQLLGITSIDNGKPFKVAVEKKLSKAENAYYEFSQTRIPFPDGLNTFLRIEGVVIPMGKVHPSKTSKNPTREGDALIVIGNQLYTVTAYLTETKSGYYVKLIAHIKSFSKTSVKATQVL
jgi:hypothetical protein